ncbi:MAG: hypothetical protein INF88_16435 [Roseomonas sp.]|nr:hypothetical protein [Roseomonas sp.]
MAVIGQGSIFAAIDGHWSRRDHNSVLVTLRGDVVIGDRLRGGRQEIKTDQRGERSKRDSQEECASLSTWAKYAFLKLVKQSACIILRTWQLIHLFPNPCLPFLNSRQRILRIGQPANEKRMAGIVLVFEGFAEKNDEIAEPAMAVCAHEASFEVGWKLLVLQGCTQFLPHILFGSFAGLRSARCIARIGL